MDLIAFIYVTVLRTSQCHFLPPQETLFSTRVYTRSKKKLSANTSDVGALRILKDCLCTSKGGFGLLSPLPLHCNQDKHVIKEKEEEEHVTRLFFING